MSQSGPTSSNGSGAPVVETLTGNSGGPVGPDGSFNIDILGNNSVGIDVIGTPASNLLTIVGIPSSTTQIGVLSLATDAESIDGTVTDEAIVPSSLAAKLGSQTLYGLAIGNSTSGALNWTAAGTDGQIPIAATGGDPAFATITSTGATITFTPGPNTLNMEAAASVPTSFDTDSGSAVPALNILQILGGTLLNTAGATNVVTINADDNVVGSVSTDGSAATPASNAFTIAGGNNCTTSGAGATVTIDVDDNVADTFDCDTGSAVPALGVLTVAGGTGCSTTGAASTVTIDLDSDVALSYTADSGSAVPSANVLTVIGSGGITTSGSGSTLTIEGTSEQVISITPLVGSGNMYTVLSTDYYMSCDVSGGTIEIDLPNAPSTGKVYIVKDAGGDATTNNITVTTVGGAVTIDGATTFVMNTNYEAANFVFNGNSYEVF